MCSDKFHLEKLLVEVLPLLQLIIWLPENIECAVGCVHAVGLVVDEAFECEESVVCIHCGQYPTLIVLGLLSGHPASYPDNATEATLQVFEGVDLSVFVAVLDEPVESIFVHSRVG